MPYSGMTSQEVQTILKRSRASLEQTGILQDLFASAVFPFGKSRPLYNAEEVYAWRLRLLRREGLVRLGLINAKTPVLAAKSYSSDEFDILCPVCGEWAYAHPETTGRGQKPIQWWCSVCGVVNQDLH